MGSKKDTELLYKIAKGSASDLEHQVFNEWLSTLNASEYEEVLSDFEKLVEQVADEDVVSSFLWEKIKLKVEDYEQSVEIKKRKAFPWFSVAASLLLIGSLGLYLQSSKVEDISHLSFEQRLSNDVLPGKNEAYLELADGSKIVLDESASAKILEESGVVVKKSIDGKLLYDFEGKSKAISREPEYHTIATPNGGEYQLVLPDGTKVWLNASSRLKFPTVFDEDRRIVELSGEAYFEVISNKAKPFIVQTERERVKVLGTEFNMSAYSNDMTSRTTLLKGRVEVSPKNNSNLVKVLQPGQQSIIHDDDVQVVQVMTDEAVAWKNGEFMFNRESIESVMRKIARWYDVEIIYKKPIGDDVKIWGTISRFDNISEVLKFIERTKVVHFKVEGRKVYVMK